MITHVKNVLLPPLTVQNVPIQRENPCPIVNARMAISTKIRTKIANNVDSNAEPVKIPYKTV